MAARVFVLAPAAEIAPRWRHPLNGLSVRQMLARLGKSTDCTGRVACREAPPSATRRGPIAQSVEQLNFNLLFDSDFIFGIQLPFRSTPPQTTAQPTEARW